MCKAYGQLRERDEWVGFGGDQGADEPYFRLAFRPFLTILAIPDSMGSEVASMRVE